MNLATLRKDFTVVYQVVFAHGLEINAFFVLS